MDGEVQIVEGEFESEPADEVESAIHLIAGGGGSRFAGGKVCDDGVFNDFERAVPDRDLGGSYCDGIPRSGAAGGAGVNSRLDAEHIEDSHRFTGIDFQLQA